MKTTLAAVFLWILVAIPRPGHTAPFYDNLRLKGSSDMKVGRVVQFDPAKSILILEFDKGSTVQYNFKDIVPLDLYQIWKKQIREDDAAGRRQLAEYARENLLFQEAKIQYILVAEKDPKLKPEMDAKIKECDNQHARILVEDGLELAKKNTLESLKAAVEKFKDVMLKYPDSDYAAKAKEEDKKVRDGIKFINDEKALEAKRLLEEKQRKEHDAQYKALADKFDRIVKMVDDAKNDNKSALILEAKHRISEAIRSWQSAEKRLLTAQEEFTRFQEELKDPKLLAAVKEKSAETSQTLVTVYRLASGMYLGQGNHQEANRWVSYGLAVDPNDAQLNDMRVQIIKIKLIEQGKLPRDR